MIRRVAGVVLAAVILFAAGLWFGGRWYLARSVAPESGSLATPDLTRPVEITFDAKGIPQVWAATDGDAFYALGWLHASERLFQMELIRRVAEGRLAELLGPALYPTDVRARQMGFARKAHRDLAGLDSASRALLERYLAGINRRIATAPVLPPEFAVLGTRPAPWTLDDVAAVAIYQTYFASALMDRTEDYRKLLDALGPAAAAVLGTYDAWSPSTVPPSGAFPFRMTLASNSWVVSPRRSASGGALHESDPHLQIDQAPGLWYAAGLHSAEGLGVVGVAAPGLPFVAMGHNAAISWAFTVAPVDIVDEYREHFDPRDHGRVRAVGGWAPVRTVAESIAVRGERRPRVLLVRETPRGVITEAAGDSAISTHWAGFDLPATGIISNGFRLMRASDFAGFRRAVTGFGALSVNWTYADARGHIGYQLGTPVPIRDTGSTFALRDAADPRAAWRGFRPLAETPYAYDPAAGWLATCNNQAVPPRWPYPLPGFYDDYRIVRASQLLSAKASYDTADMRRIQLDLVSSGAVRFRGLMAAGAERTGRDALARAIGAWDGDASAGDTLATLYQYWRRDLTRELFEDELGSRWPLADPLTDATITRNVAALVDDHRTPAVETPADISARALTVALREAAGRPLGKVQTLTIRHPLAVSRLLDRWLHLTRGPYPWPGDPSTLDASFRVYDSTTATFRTIVGPSMRFILDWAHPDAFSLTLPLGESGNPLSPHFDDFFALHRAGGAWTVPFTRDSVYARAVSVLRLVPGR
ncbi:MAG TPA: penicillin acylase family protein [Gemmatimonadales bacterium]|nr:penicillin acylase family protein [Gemmatimonadales bacterium]